MNPTPSTWVRVKSLFLRASEASRPGGVLDAASGTTADAARRMLATGSGFLTDLEVDDAIPTPNGKHYAAWLFPPGTLVASRFEIVQPLGRGGMGEVYEARDQVKNVRVALKVVLPNRDLDPQIADRLLRREFSLAQMVSHRNICRIYDPYLHQPAQGPPMLVVSMELLRGKTLATFLEERGRVDPEEVVEIARQLAAGIDAAHAAGIVHRDLKPSNVLLTEEDGRLRVVITDFGLARHAAAQTVTQLSRAVAGTLRYMAPEQITGHPDKRSDLYTFALILYELLTGELPFTGDSDLTVALSRLSTQPRDPGTIDPNVSLAWRATLFRGLARQPEKRFQSAGELIRAIDAPDRPLVLWQRVLATRLRSKPAVVRWGLLTALVATAILMAVLLRPPANRFPGFGRILIADVRHPATRDGALLGAGASLVAAVEQSPHLAVVRPAELASTLAKMGRHSGSSIDEEGLRELAMRTGEKAVLSGTISKEHGYSLRLQLEAMGTDPRRPAAAVEREFKAADEQGVFDAIATAASWVRKLSGEGARELDEQSARPEDLTTGSWEALRLLQEARARRAANDSRSAAVFVKEALDLDPEFAAAEAFSADVHTDLQQYREAFEDYRRALELIKKRNVTGRERYKIEAAYDVDAGNQEDSLRTYEAWIAHFPQDYLPHFYRGHSLFHQGDYQAALAELQRAQQLSPSTYVIFPHLAAAYLANGQYESAEGCAGRLRELGEDDWALEVEGLILLAQHRFEEAAEKVAPLAARTDGLFASMGPRYIASALADSGRLREAELALAARADTERETNSRARFAKRELDIAYLRWMQGDSAGTRTALTSAAQDLDNPDSLSLASALFARLGDLSSARRVLSLMNRWPNLPRVAKALERARMELELAAHRQETTPFVAGSYENVASPLDLEFLLYRARTAGRNGAAERVRSNIRERKDILLSWDDRHAPPGLYWLAACGDSCRPR